MSLRQQVDQLIGTRMKEISHPVQGYIPAAGMNLTQWSCTVRVPNQHGGTHPSKGGDARYHEYKDVPLPYSMGGVIEGLGALVADRDRGVTLGFKGGNQYHPYIINFLSYFHEQLDQPTKSVENRQPHVAHQFTTGATPNVAAGPPVPNGPTHPVGPAGAPLAVPVGSGQTLAAPGAHATVAQQLAERAAIQSQSLAVVMRGDLLHDTVQRAAQVTP